MNKNERPTKTIHNKGISGKLIVKARNVINNKLKGKCYEIPDWS